MMKYKTNSIFISILVLIVLSGCSNQKKKAAFQPIEFKRLEYPLIPADASIGGAEWVAKLREARLKLESDKSGVVEADVQSISLNPEKSGITGAFYSIKEAKIPHWQSKINRKDKWDLVKTGPIKASSNVKNSIFELRNNGVKIFEFRAAQEGSYPAGIQGIRVFDDGWVLEYAQYAMGMIGGKPGQSLKYQVVVDGKLLNKEKHYQNCFDYVRYNGKQFYFFQRGGKYGWKYDERAHPQIWNMVVYNPDKEAPIENINYLPDGPEFFAVHDGMWYYTKLLAQQISN